MKLPHKIIFGSCTVVALLIFADNNDYLIKPKQSHINEVLDKAVNLKDQPEADKVEQKSGVIILEKNPSSTP